jgi:FkbM family methyltransferase
MSLLYEFILRVRPAPLAVFFKKLLRVERGNVETPSGVFLVDPASNFGHQVQSETGYEPEMRETLEKLIQEQDTFIDLGGNEGFFSVVASKLTGPSGRVICIEPQQRLQKVLRQNFKQNGAENVEIVCSLIGDEEGHAELYESPDTNSGSSSRYQVTRYPLPRQKVGQTTLVRLFEELNIARVRLIKIDIEGAEYEAIFGARQLFQDEVFDYIALELHPEILESRGISPESIHAFLASCGYEKDDSFA